MKTIVVVSICAVLLIGCSSVANVQTDDSPVTVQQSVAKNVKVYSTAKTGQEYIVLGEVVADADAGENAAPAVDKLKVEASKLGADAIINLRLEVDTGYWQNAIKATGTAVKFK
ncbi:MAG: heavy metal-binding domain-containing protein [Bacteroidota bacterium]